MNVSLFLLSILLNGLSWTTICMGSPSSTWPWSKGTTKGGSLNKFRGKADDFMNRLGSHEFVTISHRQLHAIDSFNYLPNYPETAIIQFDAFGKHYKLRITKNHHLFGEKLLVTHRGNGKVHSRNVGHDRICHYTGEILNDDSPRKKRVALSVCHGRGIRGSFFAFNETLVIRPARLLLDPSYKGPHKITDTHIVYKYREIDRSDYDHLAPGNDGRCGHGHSATDFLNSFKEKDHVHAHESDNENGLDDIHKHAEIHRKSKDGRVKNDHTHSHDHHHRHHHREETVQEIPDRRRLSSSGIRYVELLIVNDPARVRKFQSDYDYPADDTTWSYELEQDTIDIVNTLGDYYLGTDWGSDVGEVSIRLTSIDNWADWATVGTSYRPTALINARNSNGGDACEADEPSDYCGGCTSSSYCEADYQSYLSKFHDWRRNSGDAPEHDNAQLFSRYDFYDSVIGYASLPGMCITSSSGGIEQCTYDNEYNGNILAHEMGHNFDMSHDGNGNSCDESDFIMASVGNPNGYRPDEFSSCSVVYMNDFFDAYSNTLKCLNNEPTETRYAICGNKAVESGEACDCGKDDCSQSDPIDPCCDGELCQLYAEADCSANDDCCSNECEFLGSSTVCRVLDTANGCDLEEETCSGTSATCPPDRHGREGTLCFTDDDTDLGQGMCYNALCRSAQAHCVTEGLEVGSDLQRCSGSGYGDASYEWKVGNTCGEDTIGCADTNTPNSCQDEDDTWPVGIPCYTNGIASQTQQCRNSQCQNSTNILTYKWLLGEWGECSLTCVDEDNPSEVGVQERTVECSYQDNVLVGDNAPCIANKGDPPANNRTCNNYICDFCRKTADGHHRCYPNGDCDSKNSVCDCDYGYAGETCDEAPSLTWVGITKRVSLNYSAPDPDANGTITGHEYTALRADPGDNLNRTNDGYVTTIPVPGIYDLSNVTNLTIGDGISLRWNSTGNLEYLAVGLWNLDPDEWVTYVGSGITENKQECDMEDPFLLDSSCDDFSFAIPLDIETGFWKILVRYNNEFTLYSKTLVIECSEAVCNSTGHGYCDESNDFGGQCQCTDDWYGSDCSQYKCNPWQFIPIGGDAYSDPIEYPRCINMEDSCNPAANTTDQLCGDCSSGSDVAHFVGPYCEIPIDGCGDLTPAECIAPENNPWCQVAGSECVYSSCAGYNEDECGRSPNVSSSSNETLSYNATWNCFWDSSFMPSGLCRRKHCGDIESDYGCLGDSLRRPLNEYESICDGWYCDCFTRSDSETTFFVDSTNVEASHYEDDDPLKICGECSLNCEHGSEMALGEDGYPDCTICEDCPSEELGWEGKECNELHWVISTRIEIDWDTAYAYKAQEFSDKYLQDWSYLTGASLDRLSLWQLKGSRGGTIAYWRYVFETNETIEAQAEGGLLFFQLRDQVSDSASPVYRGWLTNYTDSGHSLVWCLPYAEECDPDEQFDYIYFFIIAVCVSFGFQFVCVLVFRIATRKQRRERYEKRVREVREAQMRLMEAHGKARRVGLRDVSKSRARAISAAKHEAEKERNREMKAREKREKAIMEEQRGTEDDFAHDGNPRKSSKARKKSEIELGRPKARSIPSDSGRGRGGSESSHGAASLPPGWKTYHNADGIPYYYNANTGETTWRHPRDVFRN